MCIIKCAHIYSSCLKLNPKEKHFALFNFCDITDSSYVLDYKKKTLRYDRNPLASRLYQSHRSTYEKFSIAHSNLVGEKKMSNREDKNIKIHIKKQKFSRFNIQYI